MNYLYKALKIENPCEKYVVEWSYLLKQFSEIDEVLENIKSFVKTGDFTLGKPLEEFEKSFASKIGTKYAIGVNSGTDAIKLSLKALGVGFGDEVITAANTFVATVGAINEIGAKPVLVDCTDDFCIDVEQIENCITPKTKAIVAVHLTGQVVDMTKLMEIASKHNIPVIEDACQGMFAEIGGRRTGTFGVTGCFSLHPLKAMNVWGDGGLIVTDDEKMCTLIRQYRNHGLKNRDEIVRLGYNSRLDSLQAVVGNWLIKQADWITQKRIDNAKILDSGLMSIPQIKIPPRYSDRKLVYHLYIVFAERRDDLFQYCHKNGIEVKVHYPIPLYLQEGLRFLGYASGDFPVTDRHAREMLSFPLHQYHTREQMQYAIDTVKEFYENR
jgi:dTDP-4-amino-4,6-dideoxygalactose transaminase